jgi:hypothetical protein
VASKVGGDAKERILRRKEEEFLLVWETRDRENQSVKRP